MVLEILLRFLLVLAIAQIPLLLVPLLVWAERRVSAWIQHRSGPNRVGPFGLLQPVADAVKLLFKEDIVPERAARGLYVLAPMVSLFAVLVVWAVIPIGDRIVLAGHELPLQIADVSIGILFFLALAPLEVVALSMAGWGSGSKYPLLGALRAGAQMLSYEVVLALAVLAVVVAAGSLRGAGIVENQAGWLWGFLPNWNLLRQPLTALLFVIAMVAEANRLPFDLPEAEPELVGGYHTEYSSMKFALFFMAEYASMVALCGLFTTLFLGGWTLPWTAVGGAAPALLPALLGVAVFLAKVLALLFGFIWLRWTLPRLRFLDLLRLSWRQLIPLALVNLVAVALLSMVL
ncbi:MAG: NADH-quinone oxidoreductase subunit H [Planctomycetes bacterium]|nr:NADH-quinone oxidoreductase subunit H [Planctomycetota bacterium]